ncbi:hypothetical protein, partial [Arthrobacter sp. GN70]|uniref:hypothetical protein n=1 Tax=Arthrobacter sp. GN70 TaxID=2838876 RepID=UPI001BFDD772
SKNNRYQQTWHTIEFSNNRHTRHHPTTVRIAPEQLSKLTRTGEIKQTSVSAIHCSRGVPTRPKHTGQRTIFRLFIKGVGRYFSASAAATRTTLHTSRTAGKFTLREPRTPPIRGENGRFRTKGSRRRRNPALCAAPLKRNQRLKAKKAGNQTVAGLSKGFWITRKTW